MTYRGQQQVINVDKRSIQYQLPCYDRRIFLLLLNSVECLKYLDSAIADNARYTREIKSWIAIAIAVFKTKKASQLDLILTL